MPSLQTSLQNLLKAAVPNATAIGQALIQVENLHKQLTALHQSYTDKAVALLSFDQKSKLADLQKAQKLESAIHEAAMLDLSVPDAQGPNGGMRPAMGGPGAPRQSQRQGPRPMLAPPPPPPPQQ
jgi:hypothetical protein